MDIMRGTHDFNRGKRALFYLNDTHADANWHRQALAGEPFSRPDHWPEHDPLVRILAWTFLSNHFHIVLQEFREGGTAKFMQRFCGSMSTYFNIKYGEKGSLFQGSYHSRTVSDDEHLKYLAFYVLVKNVLDMYPGGLHAAQDNFDDAWEWAKHYSYSSLQNVISSEPSPILDDEEQLISSLIGPGDTYKQEARELLDFHMSSRGEGFTDIMLESW